jgi:hypothetical protein
MWEGYVCTLYVPQSHSYYQKVVRLSQDFGHTVALGDFDYPNTTSTTKETIIESGSFGFLVNRSKRDIHPPFQN